MQTWKALALMSFAFVSQPAVRPFRRRGEGTFVDLSYPAEALAERVTGTVVVRADTDASGRVVDAEPLSGPAALRPAAVANVRQWTFGPELRRNIVVYRFEIDLARCNDDSRSLFRLVYPNLALVTACTGSGRTQAPRPRTICLLSRMGPPRNTLRLPKGRSPVAWSFWIYPSTPAAR